MLYGTHNNHKLISVPLTVETVVLGAGQIAGNSARERKCLQSERGGSRRPFGVPNDILVFEINVPHLFISLKNNHCKCQSFSLSLYIFYILIVKHLAKFRWFLQYSKSDHFSYVWNNNLGVNRVLYFHSFSKHQVWVAIRFQSLPEMHSLCLVSVVVSLVVKSYNYSQLVLMWVVGIKQQILISVSGFPVNFNFQATPLPPPTDTPT